MKFKAALLAFAAIFCGKALAQPTFLERLEGGAAECAVVGSSASTNASIAGRDIGEQSAQYKKLVADSFRDAQDCVENGKPAIKLYYKAELAEKPTLKPALTDAYAAWLGYMDWLRTPHEWGEEAVERKAFEAAANKLRAEIEAM
jgi:hypothetical protein